ncbi:hypothetical protein GMMP15_150048 [Candidatus Magnetomoraceae bacterium gMMP-15]
MIGSKLSSCPATIKDLIQSNPDCARILQRDDLIDTIKIHFNQQNHYIVLYGQRMVGKTFLLQRMSGMLQNEYIPIILNMQEFKNLNNLDSFEFELIWTIIYKTKQWANDIDISINLDTPKHEDFKKHGFNRYWDKIKQIKKKRQYIIMIDEIEELLSSYEKVNSQVLKFLYNFICNPENGKFIIVGFEQYFHNSNNQHFNRLLANGRPIRVDHYKEDICSLIFSATQQYFTCENDILRYYILLCDGHPRILNIVYEATIYCLTKELCKNKLENNDIELIKKKLLEQCSYAAQSLYKELSQEERLVIKIISQKSLNKSEYFLHELHELIKDDLHLDNSKKVDKGWLKRFLKVKVIWKKFFVKSQNQIINDNNRVFLSHNSKDKTLVKKIKTKLEKAGISTWLDESKIRGGDPWQKVLEKELIQARTAIVFLGKNGLGRWQDREVEVLLSKKECRIIPVYLENCKRDFKPSVFINSLHHIDFRKKNPEPIDMLIQGIKSQRSEKDNTITELKSNYDSLYKGLNQLENREWIEWKNKETGLFSFKLGLIPLWFRNYKFD